MRRSFSYDDEPNLDSNVAHPKDEALAFNLLAAVDKENLSPPTSFTSQKNNEPTPITLSAPPQAVSWDNLGKLPIQELSTIVKDVHPQFAALILSRLPRAITEKILINLPHGLAGQIFSRLANLSTPAPDAINLVDNKLFKELSGRTLASTKSPSASSQSLIRLIHAMPAATQIVFVEHMQKSEGSGFLAFLESQNLTYIAELSPPHIQTLFYQADLEVFGAAFSGNAAKRLERVLAVLSNRARSNVLALSKANIGISQLTRIKAQLCLIALSNDTVPKSDMPSTSEQDDPLASILEL